MKKILIFFFVIIFASQAYASRSWEGNTCTTTTATQTDVAGCVNDVTTAKTGTVTISIAAGTESWASTVVVNMSAAGWANVTSLIIQGAGKTSTVLTDVITASHFNNALLTVYGMKTAHTLRITGIGFVADSSTVSAVTSGLIAVSGYSTSDYSKTVRIDSCAFTISKALNGQRMMLIAGVYGVIDGNTFTNSLTANTAQGILVKAHPATGSDIGEASWARTVEYASANAVYIENNTFTWSSISDSALDGSGGARVVFRYNTVTGTNVGMHGRMSGGHHGAAFAEYYNNAFTSTSNLTTGTLIMASGTGVAHHNTFTVTTLSPGITFQYYRSCADCTGTGCDPLPSRYSAGLVAGDGTTYATITNYPSSPTYITNLNCTGEGVLSSTHGWGRCNGTNKLDGNTDATGWPCASQPGTSGAAFNTSNPIYTWSNYRNGALDNGALLVGLACTSPAMTDHVQANRDYFNNGTTAKTGYTTYTCPHPTVVSGTCGETAGTGAYILGSGVPVLTAAVIAANGTTLTLTGSRALTVNNITGLAITLSSGAATLSYVSGSGTTSIVLTISRTVTSTATASLTYTQPGNGIEALDDDVDLATFPSMAVTNGSEQSNSVHTVTPSAGTGCAISPASAQTIVNGLTSSFTADGENNYTVSAFGGTCGGTGAGTIADPYVTSAVTGDCTVTVTCSKIAAEGKLGAGPAARFGVGAAHKRY